VQKKYKRVLITIIIIILIPIIIIAGVILLKDRQYALVSMIIAIAACIPFFIRAESKKSKTSEMIIIAVMVALSSAGRFVFAAIPFFKPVTAIVVVAAIYLGAESGFLIGALSALISNIYFGQGPWTPFQMFIWGLIGFTAGLMAVALKNNRILLAVYGCLAGFAFSLVMDTWTVLWLDGSFNLSRYLAAIITSLPITAVYAISNIIFLLILQKPMGAKLARLKSKYGLF
jgi:uncharacterized membrane protein